MSESIHSGMKRLAKTTISIIAALILTMSLFSTFSPQIVAGQSPVSKDGALIADANWREVDETGLRNLSLTAISRGDGIDIYVERLIFDAETFEFLSGHMFTSDTNVLKIDRRLESATLSNLTIEVCDPFLGQQDEQGNCLETLETLTFESIQWAASSNAVSLRERDRVWITEDLVLIQDKTVIRRAEASGVLNDEDLGVSSTANLEKSRSLVVVQSVPGKPPTGNVPHGSKGVVANWFDATIDGSPASVSIIAMDAPDGRSMLLLFITSDTRYVGEMAIAENVLTIDHNSASLSETDIVVCPRDSPRETCPEGTERTLSLSASWETTGEPIGMISQNTKVQEKGEPPSTARFEVVIMPAMATSSLGTIDLGESDDAAIILLVDQVR